MEIGNQIRIMRMVRGWHQKPFARSLGWKDDARMSHIEQSKVFPSTEDVCQIKEALAWPPTPLDALAFAILEGEIATDSELVEWLDRQGIVHLPRVDLAEMIAELPFSEPPDPAA